MKKRIPFALRNTVNKLKKLIPAFTTHAKNISQKGSIFFHFAFFFRIWVQKPAPHITFKKRPIYTGIWKKEYTICGVTRSINSWKKIYPTFNPHGKNIREKRDQFCFKFVFTAEIDFKNLQFIYLLHSKHQLYMKERISSVLRNTINQQLQTKTKIFVSLTARNKYKIQRKLWTLFGEGEAFAPPFSKNKQFPISSKLS